MQSAQMDVTSAVKKNAEACHLPWFWRRARYTCYEYSHPEIPARKCVQGITNCYISIVFSRVNVGVPFISFAEHKYQNTLHHYVTQHSVFFSEINDIILNTTIS